MKINFRFCRRSLFASTTILCAISLVIAIIVIPPVKADTFPLATPEAAATAFWVSVLFHLLIATMLFFNALRFTEGSGSKTGVLVSLAIFTVLLALVITDAASAFLSHGPALQSATTFIFLCAAGDFLVAILLISIAVLLRRRT